MSDSSRGEWATCVVLASASPRRRDLLAALGVAFRVAVADIDEQVLPREAPDALTMRLSQTKALTVAARLLVDGDLDVSARDGAEPVVLAADTVVSLDGALLNKPADADEALAMLGTLRGRTHQVYTGIALAVGPGIAWCSTVETRVTMREYSDYEVARYIATGSPFDKAGGYGIQDADFRPVARIDGCYANVVGLPLCEVRRALETVDPTRVWGPGWHNAVQFVSSPSSCACASIDTRWYGQQS